VCLVHRAGELAIVEYGCPGPLATCRTEHASPYLLSVVLAEARGALPAARAAAYLVDAQTARLLDLATGQALATVSHDARIDWLVRGVAGWQRRRRCAACRGSGSPPQPAAGHLAGWGGGAGARLPARPPSRLPARLPPQELNPRGTHLLFRDKRRHLHVYDVAAQRRATLLTFCQYAQWVGGPPAACGLRLRLLPAQLPALPPCRHADAAAACERLSWLGCRRAVSGGPWRRCALGDGRAPAASAPQVPDSDVVVAQSRGSLCIWYNVAQPDQVRQHELTSAGPAAQGPGMGAKPLLRVLSLLAVRTALGCVGHLRAQPSSGPLVPPTTTTPRPCRPP
jgi:hypothetical protein